MGVDDGEVDAATALSGIENDGGELGEVGHVTPRGSGTSRGGR